jgi:exopolysaccharide production protein ExoY
MTLRFQDFPAAEAVPSPAVSAARRKAPLGVYRRLFKRAFDVCAVVMAAPVVVPLIGMLALTVALNGGQAFYTQDRVGKSGRTFRMWKLRSMVRNADALMEAHLAADPAARAEWDATQKLKDDPRITGFGRFLRRSSLDELPQLWNVVTGDMSLVGPRPMMVNQRDMYPGTAYYALRPGITGLWQTAGRNRTTFAARAEFDADYEADVTLKNDISILLRTVNVVVNATGY